MPLFTHNKKIAVKPFPNRENKTTTAHGLSLLEYNQALAETEVVFGGNHSFLIGTKIFVIGEAVKHKWASEIYRHEGVEFILLPEEQVQAYESFYPADTAVTTTVTNTTPYVAY